MTKREVAAVFRDAVHASWAEARANPDKFVARFTRKMSGEDSVLHDEIMSEFGTPFANALRGTEEDAISAIALLEPSQKPYRGRKMRLEIADRLFSGFKERLAQLNAVDEYGVSVRLALLFGSYLGQAKAVGDIDIAVIMRRLPNWETKFDEINSRKRAYEMTSPEAEAVRFLKNRSGRISIHEFDDIASLECSLKVIHAGHEWRDLVQGFERGSISRAEFVAAVKARM